MPPLDNLLAFATVAFVLIVVPGPSVLFVIGRALALGRGAALASVAGNAIGVFVQAVLVAFGLGTLIGRSIAVLTALKFAGAAYLVFLGVQAIRERRALAAMSADLRELPGKAIRFRQGFVVGASNPKGFALFTAVLPQFVDTTGSNITTQMLVFAATAVSIALVTDSAWAAVAGAARGWFARSPRRTERLGLIGGTMMIGLGIQLAVSGGSSRTESTGG